MPIATPLPAADPGRIGQYRLAGRLVPKTREIRPQADEPTAGTTYLAGTSRNEPVTITLLDPVSPTDSATRDRFMAEARVARRVAPFCAARILDAGFHGEFPYLVCEYVPGPSLREAVETEGPRGSEALHAIATGAATGLAAIHQAGLVHGDFGPDHLVLGRDGPRILHAGISPPYGPLTPTGDVLAWARTVLFAASGQRRQGPSQPREVTSLPEPLRQVIAECLDPEPAARPAAKMVVTRLLGHSTPPAGVLAEGSRLAAGLRPVTGGPAPDAAGGDPVPAPAGRGQRSYPSWRGGAPWRAYTAARGPAGPAGARPGGTQPAGPPGGAAAASPPAASGPAIAPPAVDHPAGHRQGGAGADPRGDRYFRNPDVEAGAAVSHTGPHERTALPEAVPAARPARTGRTPARPAGPPPKRRRPGRAWGAVAAGLTAVAAIGAVVYLQHSGSGPAPAPVPSRVRQADPRPSTPVSSPPAPSGSATPEIPSAFSGSWNGTVHQRGSLGLSFAVQLSLTRGGQSGTVTYPSLGCSGPLTPVSASSQTLVLQQGVVSGQQTCGQGTITLTQSGGGTLSYSFSPQVSGGPATTGTLTRQ